MKLKQKKILLLDRRKVPLDPIMERILNLFKRKYLREMKAKDDKDSFGEHK